MSNDRIADLLRNANPVTGEPRRPIDAAWNAILAMQREVPSDSKDLMRPASKAWMTPRRILTAAAAMLLIAGVSTVVTLGGPNGSPSLSSTITRAFGVVNAGASTGGFSPTTSPSGLNRVTCPTSQVCYLESEFAFDKAGKLIPPTAYKTVDGGSSWTAMPMPDEGNPDTSFSCPTALVCSIGEETPSSGSSSGAFAVGTVQSMLSTTDGGATWTSHVVSINPVTGTDPSLDNALVDAQGSWNELQCFSSTSCIAAATTPSDQPLQPVNGVDESGVYRSVIMRTDDGGATWTSVVLPWSTNVDGSPGWSSSQDIKFSCPTSMVCVGLMQVIHSVVNNTQTANVLVWRSDDGGATWTSSWAPAPAETGGSLDCPTTLQCYAVVGTGSSFPSRTEQIMVTSDGGLTWTFESPSASTSTPHLIPYFSISCTDASTCWVAGDVPVNGDSSSTQASIWSTSDSGATWASVPLPAQLGLVVEVACNPVSSCLAMALPPLVNGTIAPSAEILSNQEG